MSPYIHTVTTASRATAVQVVICKYLGKKTMQHIGLDHDEHELALLKAQTQRILDGDQMSLDLGLGDVIAPAGTCPIDKPLSVSAQRAGYLLDCIDTLLPAFRFRHCHQWGSGLFRFGPSSDHPTQVQV